MSSYNPTAGYARNARRTNDAQSRIANLESEYQRSVLGDHKVRDQDAIRHGIFRFKALLGSIRNFASWLIQEQKQNLEASKNLNELTKFA